MTGRLDAQDHWEGADDELVSEDVLKRASCSEPHDAEVAGSFELSGGEYPGVAGFDGWAQQICPAEFERYVGLPFEQSSLMLSYHFPDETLWSRGGRSIDCFVTTGGPGQVVDFPLRGSGL
ncbi:MAG: septum formation family protein [Chloroflexota bacterium]